MVPELFLTCALSLPAMTFKHTGKLPLKPVISLEIQNKMRAPFNTQIELTRMLLAFTSEFTYSENRRILVIGNLRQMVNAMRRQKFEAFGLIDRIIRNRFIVIGKDHEVPFNKESFRMVISPKLFTSIFDVTALAEAHRVLVPGGFLIIKSGYLDQTDKLLKSLGYTRLPFITESLAIFQKRGRPRIYWGPLERNA